MELFSEAIAFAVQAHDAMRRKGGGAPYILHPLEAAVIVGSMTNDQEVLAAAVLHDVVEDAGVTPEELCEKFGPRVRDLVLSETEDKRQSLPAEQTWLLRKEEAVTFLRGCSDRSVKMLYLGDKLSNLRSLHRDLPLLGPELWQRFHQHDPEKHHWYYRAIAEATRELAHTAAWQEYDCLIDTIFCRKD